MYTDYTSGVDTRDIRRSGQLCQASVIPLRGYLNPPSLYLSTTRSMGQILFPPYLGLGVGLGREVRDVCDANLTSTSMLSNLL